MIIKQISLLLKYVFTLLFLNFFVVFPSTGETNNHLPLTAAASPSVEPIVVYAVLGTYSQLMALNFEKKTGIRVQVIYMQGNGAVLERVRAEKGNGIGDVWFGGSIGAHIQAANLGLLAPLDLIDNTDLTPQIAGPFAHHRVYGLYAGYLGILVNETLLSAHNVPKPTSWQDLLSPRYQGMISMKNPAFSGTAFTTLASLITLMGEEAAFKYLYQLNKNIKDYQSGQTYRVCQGLLPITITFFHEVTGCSKVDIFVPKEGAGYEIGGISRIKRNGQQSEHVQRFINYVLSYKGQMQMPDTTFERASSNKRTQEAFENLSVPLNTLPAIDFEWMGKNRDRLVKKWYDMVLLGDVHSSN